MWFCCETTYCFLRSKLINVSFILYKWRLMLFAQNNQKLVLFTWLRIASLDWYCRKQNILFNYTRKHTLTLPSVYPDQNYEWIYVIDKHLLILISTYKYLFNANVCLYYIYSECFIVLYLLFHYVCATSEIIIQLFFVMKNLYDPFTMKIHIFMYFQLSDFF